MRIDQWEHAVAKAPFDRADRNAVLLQSRSPEVQTTRRYLQRDFHGKPVPNARRRHLGPWEERQIRSRVPRGVRVEKVIRARVILIDRFLHEPHAENAGIEIQILLCRSRNRGDVMKTVDAVHDLIVIAWRLLQLRISIEVVLYP